MKKLLLSFVFLLFIGSLFSTEWVQVSGQTNEASAIELVPSNSASSVLHFTLSGYYFKEVMTDRGASMRILFDEGAPIMRAGAPDLPLMATSLVIPDRSQMEVVVLNAKFKEYQDVLITPSKGNLTRDIDPESIPYTFGKYYENDAFYPGEVASLREPYIMRDLRGQTLMIKPFQYNPVTKVLRVYHEITVEIVENGLSRTNVLDIPFNPEKVNAEFNQIYARHFINYTTSNRYNPVEEEGNMLIICHADFMDSIQPFIDWKIKTGMQVELVDVATIGGASAIKTYIADYYNTKGLTYVLLVGDSQQVPSSSIGGNDSDNNYTYVVGSDHYPDLFCGRFSAENVGHVATQVQRVLEYEQNPIADTAWYRKLIGVASSEGPGDDGEYDYQHIRKIGNEKLIPYTYNYAYEYFDGSQGGNDAPGSPSAATVAEGINSGATIINYTGHGSTTSWSSSGFSNTNVNQLVNVGKLPFIFSVACVNGNFVGSTCFAEAWMRAEDNNQPTGAIATLMSTINQSWNPPMAGQDEMNDILTESYSDNIKRSFAGISMHGCMLMNDEYGSDGNEMTDTWTVFGDPSLVIRTSIPQNISASYPSELHIGETSLTLTCNAEGAKAALTFNGEILGTAFVSGGSATITFEALTELGTADFVITAYNYRPHISTIDIIPELGPFMSIAGKILNDTAGGNGDGLMDYAEDILMTMSLSNIGVEAGYGVYSLLSSTSPYIEVTGDSVFFGDLAVGDTLTAIDGFAFSVSNDLPDMSLVPFRLTSYDQDGNSWISNFMIPGHAAKLILASYSVDDATGNNNGKLDPGETADLIISIKNTGSSDAYSVITQLLSGNNYTIVNTEPLNFGDILAGETNSMAFNVTAAGDTPPGFTAVFTVEALGNNDVSLNDNFYTIVGQIPVLIVNMANSASADSMMACLDVLQVGGEVVTELPETLEIYSSVFVLLGAYPDNHVLSTEEGSALAAYLNIGGRVYMEGGDTWAFDEPTAAHELFFIKGLEDGDGDLGTITGDDMNFMNGYSYAYNGINNYVDRLGPYDGGSVLMTNTSPEYATAISYHNETYKTIGASFEFAGLSNGLGSTMDEAMAEFLNFFNVSFTWTGLNETAAELYQVAAYPNPFADQVVVSFDLSETSEVRFEVYDMSGRQLYNTPEIKMNPGSQNISWNTGHVLPGIYMIKLTLGQDVITKKLVRIN